MDVSDFLHDLVQRLILPTWTFQIYFLSIIPLIFAFFAAFYRISFLLKSPVNHYAFVEPTCNFIHSIRSLLAIFTLLVQVTQLWTHPLLARDNDVILNSLLSALYCISLIIVLIWMYLEHKKSKTVHWIFITFWFLNLMSATSNFLIHLQSNATFVACLLPGLLIALNLVSLSLSIHAEHTDYVLPKVSMWTWLKYTLHFNPTCKRFPSWLLPTSLVERETGNHEEFFASISKSSLIWIYLHVLLGIALVYFLSKDLIISGILMCFLGWTMSISKLHLGIAEVRALKMLTTTTYLTTLRCIFPPKLLDWLQLPHQLINEATWLKHKKLNYPNVILTCILLSTFFIQPNLFVDMLTPWIFTWIMTYVFYLLQHLLEQPHFETEWTTNRFILKWLQSMASARCSFATRSWITFLKKEHSKETRSEVFRHCFLFAPMIIDQFCFFYSCYCLFQSSSSSTTSSTYVSLAILVWLYGLKQSIHLKPSLYDSKTKMSLTTCHLPNPNFSVSSTLHRPAIYIEGYLHCFYEELTVLLGEPRMDVMQSILKYKIAYVSKVPWFIQGNLHENIVFGKDWDPEWFAEVIKVTELSEEIMILKDAPIGINGSCLTEQQKMKVNFARAIYSRENVIFIEDPPIKQLNLVQVFEQCFGKRSITSSLCRIWMTQTPCIPCNWIFPLNTLNPNLKPCKMNNGDELEKLFFNTEAHPNGPVSLSSFGQLVKHSYLTFVPCIILSILIQSLHVILFTYLYSDAQNFGSASLLYLTLYTCLATLAASTSWKASRDLLKKLIKRVSDYPLALFQEHTIARLSHYFINDFRCFQSKLPSIVFTLTMDIPFIITAVVMYCLNTKLDLLSILIFFSVFISTLFGFFKTVSSKNVPFAPFFQNLYRGITVLHSYYHLNLAPLRSFLHGLAGIWLEKKLARYWVEFRLSIFYAIMIAFIASPSSCALFYVFGFIQAIQRLIDIMPHLRQLLSSFERIQLASHLPVDLKQRTAEHGDIRCVSVSSKHLTNISWTFRKNVTMGLYGPSAKHLFWTLLGANLYQGTIRVNFDDFKPLYSNWMLIPKKGSAPPCTIREYLDPTFNYTDVELSHYLHLAGCSLSLRDRINGDQSIYVARAMLMNCDALFFEDKVEMGIVEVLRQHFQNSTIFVLSTFAQEIDWTQEVLGIKDGRAVEWGSHASLAYRPGSLYSKMRALA